MPSQRRRGVGTRTQRVAGLAIATLLLVVAAGWRLQTRDGQGAPAIVEPTSVPAATPAPALPVDAAAGARPTRLEAREAAPPAEAPEDATLATVRGVVLRRADRSPVASVAVELIAYVGEQLDGELRRHTRADDQGRFVVSLPAPGELDEVIAGAGPDSVPAVAGDGWELHPGETLEVEVLVDAGLQLVGRVVDATGAAWPGATVRAWLEADGWPEDARGRAPDRSTRTDGAGRFRLEALGPGFVVDAVAPGARSRRRLMGRAGTGHLALERPFVLAAERWIETRVRDLSGRPLAIEVDVAHAPGFLQDTEARTAHGEVRWEVPESLVVATDAAGLARLGPLTDETWAVSVADTRYPRWRQVHAPGDGPLSILLGRGETVTGRVTDVAGDALVGALVEFECQTGQRGARTDARGDFRIDAVDQGPVGYGAWAPGHALLRGTRYGSEPLHLALQDAQLLRLQVVDAGGAPIAGVHVLPHAWRFDMTWIERMVPGGRSSDAEGRVDLLGLGAGEHVLQLEHRPTRRRREVAVQAGDAVQRIVLDTPRRVTLSGRVTDAVTGAPLTRFAVLRRNAGPGSRGGWQRTFEPADGVWSWELAADPFSLTISAEGYAPWHRPAFTPVDDPTVVDVALSPSRTLTVRLCDEQGRVARGWLTAAAVGRPQPDAVLVNDRTGTWTDEEGRAVIADLPATLIEIEAHNLAYGADASARIDLSAPGAHELTITLSGGARRPQDVVVFGGTDAVDHEAGPGNPWTLLSRHGRDDLWPVRRSVEVQVLRPDGELLETLRWSADEAGAPRRFAVEPDLGVPMARLSLLAEPLVIQVSAEGSEPQSSAWAPRDAATSHSEPLVFVLRR